MKFENTEDGTKITVEAGETDQQVLRALLQASFCLARPVNARQRNNFDPTQVISDDTADQFISRSKSGFDLEDGGGRWCVTCVKKLEDGVYQLQNFTFERDRGDPTPFLTLAQNVLAGTETLEGPPRSTDYPYEGDNLTKIAAQYGVVRKEGEDDMSLRRRTYLEINHDHIRGLEFFMGRSCVEWTKTQCMFLSFYDRPMLRQEREEFSKGMPIDPKVLYA